MGYLQKMKTDHAGQAKQETQRAIILAVETSSRIGSAALAAGPILLEERPFSGPMQHSSELFPALASLLRGHGFAPTDIGQIHISIGPGSFTGLRIAVALAKTMHLAHGVRIISVDSLDVVAANLADANPQPVVPNRIATLFDAKRGQFYASVYDLAAPASTTDGDSDEHDADYRIPAPHKGLWKKTSPDRLMTAQEIIAGFAGSERIGLLGDGLLYHRDKFDPNRVVILPERSWSPHARNVHYLGYQKACAGRFSDPLALVPFYLRGPEVTLRRNP
jgi:tRNA threonylcarbamoyladenosine biosynthesis protein TsaB